MSKYNNILLTTDLMDTSYRVAAQATELAQHYNAKLHVIHVLESVPPYILNYINIAEIEASRLKETTQLVNDLAHKLKVQFTSKIIKQGVTTTQILDTAEQLEIDLIVIGSHSMTGLARVLGSTASSVIHKANCDVLTIRYKP